MKIKVVRIAKREKYTIGKMYINDIYFCDTLEDRVRDLNNDGDLLDQGENKVMHETAIPCGTYKLIMNMSKRFKRIMPLLVDVPHFAGIRIHAGSDAGHSSGCILVGKNTIKGKLTESKLYEKQLYDLLNHQNNITIEII